MLLSLFFHLWKDRIRVCSGGTMKRLEEKKNQAIREAKAKLENEKLKKILSWVFSLTLTIGIAAITAIVMCQSVTMQESSMEPTISVGDKFFVNRLIYKVDEPKHGDIIVFRTNASNEAALHIRRVVGIPGDTIQIVDGRIILNGKTYSEGQDFPKITNAGLAKDPISLESGEYFVLGDNRNNSEDSRYGDIGIVKEKYITGKIWFKVYPVKEVGLMEG